MVEAGIANNLRNQGVNAIALVLLQEGIAAWRQRHCDARNDQQVLHARTGGQKHHQEHRCKEQCTVQVGLQDDQRHRNKRHQDGGDDATEALHMRGGAHPRSHGDHPSELNQLTGLKVQRPKIDPAARTVAWAHDRFRHKWNQQQDQERQVHCKEEPCPTPHPTPLLRPNERRGKNARDKKSKLPLHQQWLGSVNSGDTQQTQSQSSQHG